MSAAFMNEAEMAAEELKLKLTESFQLSLLQKCAGLFGLACVPPREELGS